MALPILVGVAVAALVRAAIQFAITIGIIELAERFILPIIHKAIKETAVGFGVSDEDATDFVANSWLHTAEQIGIGALTIRSKTPVKVAELLGFTSKGFVKRSLTKTAATKLPTIAGVGVKSTVAEQVSAIATVRKIALPAASTLGNFLFKSLGLTVGVGLLVINTIDFAAWPTSTYQGTFQKFFAIFGLEADKEKVSAKVLSDDQLNKAYAVFQQEGATQINNTFTGQVVPFTKQNLATLLDKIAGQMLLEDGKYTINKVIGAAIGFILKGTVASAVAPNGGSPAPRQPLSIAPISRAKTQFSATGDEIASLALGKVAGFLDGLPAFLDFELTVRANPVDETGRLLSGKFYTLQIKLRSGQFGSTKLKEIILRPLAEGEKALTTATEEPIEAALRAAVGASAPISSVAVLTTPIPQGTAEEIAAEAVIVNQKPYISFKGSPDVFERASGRYIPFAEANSLNILASGLVEALNYSRPEVREASDYALFSGRDLSNWPPAPASDGSLAVRPTGPIFQSDAQTNQENAAKRANDWQATTQGGNIFVPMPEDIKQSLGLVGDYGASGGVLYSSFAAYKAATERAL